MSHEDFDPPLSIRGTGIVIRTLDEAERYLHEHGAGHAHNWEGVLRRLQVAASPDDCRHAAHAFRGWLEAEGLLAPPPSFSRAPRAAS